MKLKCYASFRFLFCTPVNWLTCNITEVWVCDSSIHVVQIVIDPPLPAYLHELAIIRQK
jgi:hypothetical protein